MCKEISPCLVHGGCNEGEVACVHFKRGTNRAEICKRCTSVTCFFEVADFKGAGI